MTTAPQTGQADDITLPAIQAFDTRLSIPYDSIRYICGYAEQTVRPMMEAYAREAILADRAARDAVDAIFEQGRSFGPKPQGDKP